MAKEEKELPPPSLGRTIFNLLPLIILTWYLCSNKPGADPEVQLKTCGENLHKVGVMIERERLLSEPKLYNQDLKSVIPEDKMLACPVGGKDAYYQGYQPSGDGNSYVLGCKADHSKSGVPSGYPRIDFSVQEANSGETSDSKEEKITQETPSPEQVEQSPSPQEGSEVQETPKPLEATPTPAGPTPNP